MSTLPRPEYPRPHRVRQRWLNLNGEWQFGFDDESRGLRAGWHSGRDLPQRIVVPFSFEAELSGIDDTAAHPVVWYRRQVDIPADFLEERLLLHIGACDFATTIWVNGHTVGTHRGGYSPISCEIQDAARPGPNEIVVRAEDRLLWTQPRGKQTTADHPFLIDYDRTTGIWQTVWLEPVPDVFITDTWSHFHLDGNRLAIQVETNREHGGEVEAVVRLDGAEVARGRAFLQDRREGRVELEIPNPRLWSPDDPALYDLQISLRDGDSILDSIASYAGMRELTYGQRSVFLNGEPFYFRGVLDQGYFSGGWYTAASDDDLRRDVALIKALGFNGARKHQKAEDPRWLMWADRLGLVVWGEMANGRDFAEVHVTDLTREWLEIVRRDRMHPCIMAWVPLNESWGVLEVDRDPNQQSWVCSLYHLTKTLDATRPVVANDGWHYFVGDIWSIHSYEPEGGGLARLLRQVLAAPTTEVAPSRIAALPGVDVSRLPVMLTELGGIAFRDPRNAEGSEGSWGYALDRDPAALEQHLRSLVEAVRAQPGITGFVWTQLTDVQQEINGLLYFDRQPKIPIAKLRDIFGGVRI